MNPVQAPEPLPSAAAPPAELYLEVTQRVHGGFVLEAQLTVPAGITILFGPSGAGKTTILDCVAGLNKPEAGRISIGERVLFDAAQRINVPVARRSVGYVLQKLALFPHLTVEQNVEYGLSQLDAAERRERSSRVLASFRIDHLRRRRPGEISGGERQRVALARALVTRPCVLLLDEPLTALDAATRSHLIADLRAWNAANRVPVLYVTHSREEAFALGERVVVLEKGKVLAQGTPHQVLQAPHHETTAAIAGFENIFDAKVLARHEHDGTMTCALLAPADSPMSAAASDVGEDKLGPVDAVICVPHLEVPLTRAAVGTPVRIAVHAGDILLATRRPEGLSARNLLPGHIVSLIRRDVTTVAHVDCGVPFIGYVTPAAEQSLGLEPGREVWLVIKTYSCHLLEPAADASPDTSL